MTALRDALRARLLEARRSRDSAVAAVVRAAVASLENAEAVPVTEQGSSASAVSEHIAGGTAGLGGSEAERRTLSDADERGIILAEIDELRRSEAEYRAAGETERADELASGERVLAQVLAEL